MDVRDREYLGRVQNYYAKQGVLPSMSSLAKYLGFGSTSTSFALVQRLKEAGYLTNTEDEGKLVPTRKFFERQVLGRVKAGVPDEGVEELSLVHIDSYLIRMPDRTSVIRVTGDSMADALLGEGDMVVVERNVPVKPGDIVVAVVDGEYTVKYLAIDAEGQFFLRAGNAAYADIRPNVELEIFGKVVGSFRTYGK